MFAKLKDRSGWAWLYLTGTIACATLWDLRFHDIRIFDMAGLALVGGFFLLHHEPITGWLERRRSVLPLYCVVIVYAALGYVLHAHRSSIAIIALATLALALCGQRDYFKTTPVFRWLAIGHIIFFFIQFGAYFFLGETIDLYELFGMQSRIRISASIIRAAGVFQEPNSYCLNLFLLITLSVLQRPNRVLVFFAAATLLLSQSLWGMAAALVVILLNEMIASNSIRRLAIVSIATLVVLGTILNIFLWAVKSESDVIPAVYVRIIKMADDPSFRGRYIGGHFCGPAEIKSESEDHSPMPVATWLFGEGLTTSYFVQCLPANGIAFLLKSFGLVGLAAIAFGLSLALRQAAMRERVFVVAAILFSLTTYPLITYLIFWIWLAGLIVVANEMANPRSSIASNKAPQAG